MVLDDIFGSYILDARPSSEFHYYGAQSKLISLELLADDEFAFTTPDIALLGDGQDGEGGSRRQARLMRLAGLIDLDSRLTVWSCNLSLSI